MQRESLGTRQSKRNGREPCRQTGKEPEGQGCVGESHAGRLGKNQRDKVVWDRAVGSKFVLVRRPARSAPPRKILDFRPSEIVSGAIQPRGPATLLCVSVPSLIPSRADSGWGLSLSWYIHFIFIYFFGRRTCRTCSYGPLGESHAGRLGESHAGRLGESHAGRLGESHAGRLGKNQRDNVVWERAMQADWERTRGTRLCGREPCRQTGKEPEGQGCVGTCRALLTAVVSGWFLTRLTHLTERTPSLPALCNEIRIKL